MLRNPRSIVVALVVLCAALPGRPSVGQESVGDEAAASVDKPATAPNEAPTRVTNTLGMKLVRVPAGSFTMGGEAGGDFDERPAHRVTISQSFLIGATEVTNAQYEVFDPGHRELRGASGLSSGDDEAVVFVRWSDAVRFCRWLSRVEGRPYRLPTEAEWEYACRAGTTTAFSTGDELPEALHRNQKQGWEPVTVDLTVGRTPPNAWGIHDMHGNVEEWCADWYGPYASGEQTDPVGRASGDFRVTRGGSHGTPLEYLRSANRLGTLPSDRHWLVGFRVVAGPAPGSPPLPAEAAGAWARDVRQARHDWTSGASPDAPLFRGPLRYVHVAAGSDGPLYSEHNHQPALTACPNGDLLAIWYSTRKEVGRELAVVGSRLRRGSEAWEPAALFWDAPDRNDHGSALWWDGEDTLYHFNGLGTDGTWGKLALVMRTSTDSGATWGEARLIDPVHSLRHQVIAGAFQTRQGHIIVPCDAVTGGNGGTAIHVSDDGGWTWRDPGLGRPSPEFAAGASGGWIAGIHAGVAQLADGSLIALGRGDSIDGQMPRSVSADMGRTWTYSSSGLPRLGSGQRVVLLRLLEGPLLVVSFTPGMELTDAGGVERSVKGLFAALSYDEGLTWPLKKLVTDGAAPRRVDGGGNTGVFTLGPDTAEPRGYLAARQTPDGVVHLISSKQHYRFNVAWLKTPLAAQAE